MNNAPDKAQWFRARLKMTEHLTRSGTDLQRAYSFSFPIMYDDRLPDSEAIQILTELTNDCNEMIETIKANNNGS